MSAIENCSDQGRNIDNRYFFGAYRHAVCHGEVEVVILFGREVYLRIASVSEIVIPIPFTNRQFSLYRRVGNIKSMLGMYWGG